MAKKLNKISKRCLFCGVDYVGYSKKGDYCEKCRRSVKKDDDESRNFHVRNLTVRKMVVKRLKEIDAYSDLIDDIAYYINLKVDDYLRDTDKVKEIFGKPTTDWDQFIQDIGEWVFLKIKDKLKKESSS
jgi:hypothetical protein